MKHSLSIFLLLFVSVNLLLAQDTPFSKRGNDLLIKGQLKGIQDESLIEEMMPNLFDFDNKSRDLLKESSIKNFMMPPRKLAKRGSHVAYVLASCLEFYTNFNNNYKVNLSPDYISLSVSREDHEGSLLDGFNFLANNGTVSAAIMPFGAAAISTGVYATQKYKIQNFLHIFSKDTQRRQRVYEIRKALMRGNPVIIEILGDADFQKMEGEKKFKYQNINKSKAITYPLIIVGFNQSTEMFEVFNPWSKDWGSHGYLLFKYEDLSKVTQNGYVMIPD